MASPLRGADGNVEFLVHCDTRGPALDDDRLDDVVPSRTRADRPRERPHRRPGAAPEPRDRRASWWPQATERLAAHGIEVRVPDHRGRHRSRHRPGLDVVISLGGDGTMLRAVDLAYEAGVPVLGVNVGQLGYLTEVEPAELERRARPPARRRLRGRRAHGARGHRRVGRLGAGPLVRAQRGGAREGAHRPPRPARGRDQRHASSPPTRPTA